MAVITHTALETDLRLAAVLSQEIVTLLADRSSMRNSGALINHGLINGMGSDTVAIRQAGLDGYDKFASVADGADLATGQDITDASASIAVARYAMRRDLTDTAEMTGFGTGDISPQRIAVSMVGEAEKLFMELVATAMASFSATAGASGVDLSVDDWYDSIRELQKVGNTGQTFALLHPQQLSDLQGSVRSEAGALQWIQATQDLIAIKGAGFSGTFAGVDIFTHTEVTATGTTDYNGAMWSTGALGYVEGSPVASFGDSIRPAGSPLLVEFDRDPSAGLTEIVGSYHVGVAIIQNNMGVALTTDY
tara:strand:+ start:590 stop:1510 length:921 start_codon:yes stop_codon:yes gene_type:complete